MTKEDKQIHRIIFGIMVFLGVWLMTSCTTMRNAERRHDRIVENFPSVHKVDTVTIERVDTINISGINGIDTLYFTVNSVDTIRDTFYLNNEVRVVNTIWRTKDGRNALKTDVSQPDQKIIYRWKEKKIKIHEKTPLDWWQKKVWIFIFIALSFVVGYALRGIEDKINQ